MIFHTAQDIFAIVTDPAVSEGGLVTGSITWLNFVDAAMSVGLCVLGLYYLRPQFRDGIVALWDRIWSRSEKEGI